MINLSGKNIDTIGCFVYVYSTRTYMKQNFFKIGGTNVQSVRNRIKQQDTTATAEEIIVLRVYELMDTRFNGDSASAERFLRKGLKRTRHDADREWRIAEIEEIDKKAETLNTDITRVDIELITHQWEALNFAKEKFEVFKEVLFYHIPRSGKSYITIKYLSENKFKNVLFLTSYPILNEQWINLINKTKGFSDVIVLNFSDNGDSIFLKDGYDPTKRYIFFVSFQDIKGNGVVLDKEKFKDFKFIDFDLVVVDEIHRGKETIKGDQIFEIIKYKKLLGLSATPTKNLIRGTFTKDNTHRFAVEDLMKYRKLYPEQYKNIPTLKHYLYDVNKLHREELKKFYTEEDYFTWNKFLRVEDGKLKYKNLIKSFLLKHFIGDIGHDHAPITEFNPTSVLIFAEHNDSLNLLKELLDSVQLIKDNYDVFFTNSTINSSSELMELVETDFKPSKGKGTIIIANRQLTTGITLEEVDMVVFMNDWSSMDEYIQASYRCLTAIEGKKNGYVIDYLPSRCFNVLYELIDLNAREKGISFEEASKDYFKCSPIHSFEDNKFKEVDVDSFMNELIRSLNIKNVFSYTTILSEQIKKYKEVLEKLGDLGATTTNVSKKLNDEAEDKGKNKLVETLVEKLEKGENIESYKKAIDNAKYILERTLLLSFYTGFRFEDIDIIFIYIKTKRDLINIYLESIMIDGIDIDTIEFVYDNCFDKDIINEKLIFINKIFTDLLSTKNIKERLINIIKVINLINSYLGVSDIEKKLKGEVFTPFWLIIEMLNTLPKFVWERIDFKWLDPANGIGNFPIIVVQRLMYGFKHPDGWETKGLSELIPDEEERYRHIMSSMIYVCDIQPKNNWIYTRLLGGIGEEHYDLNIYTRSFLDEDFDKHMKDVWKVKKFNIVMGNPPYHDKAKGNSRLGSYPFWIKFVNKVFKVLEEEGYLVFVHPSLWRQANDKKCSVLRKKNMTYLSINDEKQGKKTFGAETRYDWYCLQNIPYEGKTIVKDQEGVTHSMNFTKWSFIPNMMFEDIEKLICKNGEDKVKILHSYSIYETRKSHMSKIESNEFKYPCIYMITKNGELNLFYSKEKKDFFVPKAIIPPGRIISVSAFDDSDGKYGLTQFSWGIAGEKDEIKDIVKFMNSDYFKKIAYACSVSKLEYNKDIIGSFKKDFYKA